ncbi:MAG: hypothetical protein Q8L76_07690, partial [Cypionkella sp.]|nr:hypothetical protein [Cypionkella sp.]
AVNSFRVTSIAIRSSLPSEQENQNLNALGIPSESETMAVGMSLSNIILLESTLSFLGLGVQPPTATLGAMVGVGRDYMPTAPWIVLAPALLILAVTFSVQILGDWLRDRADVRLRVR